MPGRLSAKQERMWKQAKIYVAKSKGKSISDLKDKDWGLVQNIFQSMKKKYGAGRVPSDYAQESFDIERYEMRMDFAKIQYLRLSESILRMEKRDYELVARGLGDIKGINPGDKDIARIMDIVTKSGNSHAKMMQLVRNMAKAITDRNKAQRRAAAALRVLPDEIAVDAAQEFMAKW